VYNIHGGYTLQEHQIPAAQWTQFPADIKTKMFVNKEDENLKAVNVTSATLVSDDKRIKLPMIVRTTQIIAETPVSEEFETWLRSTGIGIAVVSTITAPRGALKFPGVK